VRSYHDSVTGVGAPAFRSVAERLRTVPARAEVAHSTGADARPEAIRKLRLEGSKGWGCINDRSFTVVADG
jgi:hypothetical protein